MSYIEPFLSNKFAYLRFNYRTGDAAGQNMVGRATFAACSWIVDRYPGIKRFYLESNLATDKKASQINIMRTRGKRVTAEATVRRMTLVEQLRIEPEALVYHHDGTNIGAFLSGANNNGLHAANAITALFIATGQDVANVAEAVRRRWLLFRDHARPATSLHLTDAAFSDRGNLRRRHRAGNPTRGPGVVGMLRHRQSAEARGNHRRRGAGR